MDDDSVLPDEGWVGNCEICGEPYDMRSTRDSEHAAEFWNEATEEGMICHPDCGLSHGMELA